MHRILYAHMVSQLNDPAAQARAAAFAAFLPRVVDRMHTLDPNHPVVYRDAEDRYLPSIVNGFAQAGGGDRPWLVYGANVYSTARLQDIVARWPAQWPGRQLVISEYAPGGMSPVDRPLGFQQEWQIISSRPDVVLGGLAYTWATNGPEDLDRVFGLVDPWESDRRRAERAGHGVRRRRTVTRYYSGPAGSLPAGNSVVTERGDRVNWPMPSRSVRRPSLSARCVRSVVVTTSDG